MSASPLFYRKGADPAVVEASARARASFGVFWREMSWERRRIVPGTQLAVIKVPFAVPEPRAGVPTA